MDVLGPFGGGVWVEEIADFHLRGCHVGGMVWDGMVLKSGCIGVQWGRMSGCGNFMRYGRFLTVWNLDLC